MQFIKHYAYTHQPIHFDFKQTTQRFFVEEIPLYRPTGKGNFLILKIKKSDMSTWKLITVLAKAALISDKEVGYAGLKDKSATTIQYFSIPKQAEKMLKKNLTTERVEIVDQWLNKGPIKVGHLKGNRFRILLHDITPKDAARFEKVATSMMQKGIPNYYGYQRFGEDGKSYQQGREIAHSGKRLKGSREKLMVAAYQSWLFNTWLSKRVKISSAIEAFTPIEAAKKLHFPEPLCEALKTQPHPFKLFLGDHLYPYPYGKGRFVKALDKEAQAFNNRTVSPTGLLCGDNVQRAYSDARHLEEPFDDDELRSLRGDRRFAWIWPEEVACCYSAETKTLEVSFYLPKGAYATTFLEEIGKFSLHKV